MSDIGEIAYGHLPQIKAPIPKIIEILERDGIEVTPRNSDCNSLIPMQNFVFLDKLSNIDAGIDIKPIWVSNDNHILDGHHRYALALSKEEPIDQLVIGLPKNMAVRMLNKAQDYYDYGRLTNQESDASSDFINNLIANAQNSKATPTSKQLKAYRAVPIKENSRIGNFFMVNNENNGNPFDLSFDNLLETDNMGIIFDRGDNPIFRLANIWYPNLDFDKLSAENKISKEKIVSRLVAETAKKHGYDGIKYGDKLIQGF